MASRASSGYETRFRSVIKGVCWRILASLTTFVLAYLIFRNSDNAAEKAAALSGVEIVVKLLLYYGHERVWNIIRWGRQSIVAENSAG